MREKERDRVRERERGGETEFFYIVQWSDVKCNLINLIKIVSINSS